MNYIAPASTNKSGCITALCSWCQWTNKSTSACLHTVCCKSGKKTFNLNK